MGLAPILELIPCCCVTTSTTDMNIVAVSLDNGVTVAYSNNQPTINWITQSESNNAGWNVYRANSSNLGQASILTKMMKMILVK